MDESDIKPEDLAVEKKVDLWQERYDRMEAKKEQIVTTELERAQLNLENAKKHFAMEDVGRADFPDKLEYEKSSRALYVADVNSAVSYREWCRKFLIYDAWMSTYRAALQGELATNTTLEDAESVAHIAAIGMHGAKPEMPQ